MAGQHHPRGLEIAVFQVLLRCLFVLMYYFFRGHTRRDNLSSSQFQNHATE